MRISLYFKMDILLALSIVMAIVPVTFSAQCTTETIDVCLQPLLKVKTEIGSSSIIAVLTDNQIKEVCGKYSQYKDCMADVAPYCDEITKSAYQGTHDAFEWLCAINTEGYRKHRGCFGNAELRGKGDKCDSSLKKNIASYNADTDMICKYGNDALECVYTAVLSVCGTEAADWVLEFNTRAAGPAFAQFHCDISQISGTKSTDTSAGSGGSSLRDVTLTLVYFMATGVLLSVSLGA